MAIRLRMVFLICPLQARLFQGPITMARVQENAQRGEKLRDDDSRKAGEDQVVGQFENLDAETPLLS